MKRIENELFYTIGEVANKVDRTISTIKNWYRWEEESGEKILPEIHKLDKKGTRYFKEEDLATLIEFRDNITYGQMADYNVKVWGERGKEITLRKASK